MLSKLNLMAVMAGIALAAPAFAQSSEPFKLGTLAGVTGGGATIGAALNTGVKLAAKEINEKGGILGRQIVITVGDTQSDPTVASTEAKRLVFQEKVHAIIGPLVSQETVPSVSVTTEGKVLQISSAATLELTPQVGPYHFSVTSNAESQGVALVNYGHNALKAKSLAILADNGGQSKSAVMAMKKRMGELGIKVSAEQEYPFRTDDMTPQLLSLRRSSPDALLFFSSTPEDSGKVLTALRDISWSPKVLASVSMATYGPTLAKTIPAELFNNVISESYSGLTFCTGEAVGSGEFAKFSEKLKNFAPESHGKIPPSTTMYYYDALYFLKTAMEAVGSTDAAKTAAWIEENGSKVKLITTTPTPSKTTHHMWGPDSIVMVEKVNETRTDGLQKRAGC